jgi:serine/threonine protein phosphatase PrpC
MSTTVVAVQLRGHEYTLAWVGDSRAYLWDSGISQLSKDHSLVQMLVDSGQITPAQARHHPRKNIISQNLGAQDVTELQVSTKQGTLYKKQKLILCSDGLSDEVDDDEIGRIVGEAGSRDNELVKELVDAALDNGGSDNITVIVISAGSDAPDKPVSQAAQHKIDKDTLIPKN